MSSVLPFAAPPMTETPTSLWGSMANNWSNTFRHTVKLSDQAEESVNAEIKGASRSVSVATNCTLSFQEKKGQYNFLLSPLPLKKITASNRLALHSSEITESPNLSRTSELASDEPSETDRTTIWMTAESERLCDCQVHRCLASSRKYAAIAWSDAALEFIWLSTGPLLSLSITLSKKLWASTCSHGTSYDLQLDSRARLDFETKLSPTSTLRGGAFS